MRRSSSRVMLCARIVRVFGSSTYLALGLTLCGDAAAQCNEQIMTSSQTAIQDHFGDRD